MTTLDGIDLLADGIKATLLNSAALTAIVQNRVYDQVAPPGTGIPYVIYTFMGASDSNDSPREDLVATFSIWCWTTDRDKASNGAQAIHDALHLQMPLAVFGGGSQWSNYWISRLHLVYDTRFIAQTKYYKRGAEYEFRMDRRN